MALPVNADVLADLFSDLPGLEFMVWDNLHFTSNDFVYPVYLARARAYYEYAGVVGRAHNAQCYPWGCYRSAAFDGRSFPARRPVANRAMPPVYYSFYHLGTRLFRLVAQPFCAAWL